MNKITAETVLNGEKGKISGFKVITEKPVTYSLLEFEMDVPQFPEHLNVYREHDIAIRMGLILPSGKELKIDAFYFEEYEVNEDLSLKGMGETGRSQKAPCFRIRVNPKEAGLLKFTVTFKILGNVEDTLSGCIEVADSGTVSHQARVEPKRRQVFITDEGKPFALIGSNLAWPNPTKDKVAYGKYTVNQMKNYSQYGGNYFRIWDMMESGSRIKKAPYVMCQDGSAMWDIIFENAPKYNYYISFVTCNHNEISTHIDPRFYYSMWYINNGGFIDDAADFFSNEYIKDVFKTYLRYIISRWGYSENVLCWELFNEIDHGNAIGTGRIDEVRDWLEDVTGYIREIDPYGHMVSNSAGYPTISVAISNKFDFIYYHIYNNCSLNQTMNLCNSSWRGYNKPIVVGEYGFDGPARSLNGRIMGDDLMELVYGNWSCLMGGSAGTGMHWFWEQIERLEAYSVYYAASQMSKRIPWDDPDMLNFTSETAVTSNHRINVMGYKGKDYAYFWAYDNNVTTVTRYNEIDFSNETVELKMDDGIYHVCWIDLCTGECVVEDEATASGGKLIIRMPVWSKYIAVTVNLK